MRNAAVLCLLLAACTKAKEPPALVYQAVAVERRDIVVSARASGTIQPDTTVEVKSQASGEVLKVLVETGQVVKANTPMVQIDRRIPKNNVDQAQSNLEVAQARLLNAQTQKDRSDALLKSQSITQTEYDQSVARLRDRQGRGGNGAGGAAERANHPRSDRCAGSNLRHHH